MSYGPPPQDPNQQPPQSGYQQPPQGYQPPPQGYQQPPQAYGQGSQAPSMQNISAGFQRFSLGRKVLLGAGLVSFLMFFMPWYTISSSIVSDTSSGSGLGVGGLPILAFLVLIALLVAMALPLFGRRLRDLVPAMPLSDGQLGLFGATGVFIVSLLGGLIAKPSDADFGGLVNYNFGWGFYLAMLALAAMTAGGWLMYQAKE